MPPDATVFVVDDDPGAAGSVRWLLESDGLPVETFASGRQFLESCDPDRPGCLVLDLQMPDMDGLELQRRLLAWRLPPPIIFVTAYGDIPKCVQAMQAGAVSFIEKPVNHVQLLDLVHQALQKDRQRRSVEASPPEITQRVDRLTPREREVMRLLYEGKSIKGIAAQFEISFQTVSKHRTRVFQKLRVESEAELVRLLAGTALV